MHILLNSPVPLEGTFIHNHHKIIWDLYYDVTFVSWWMWSVPGRGLVEYSDDYKNDVNHIMWSSQSLSHKPIEQQWDIFV